MSYTAKDITVLEGLEPVRKRPGMYIGGVGATGLHHLVWEILDNSVDEAMNGHASTIGVTLHDDGSSVTVADNGRGIPVDVHPKTKKSALEVIFTMLHAGGKFEHGSYKTAGGLHGVGASVVNALSHELVATVRRDGQQWEMALQAGQAGGRPQEGRAGARQRHDGVLPPRPDDLPEGRVRPQIIRERLEVASFLHKGVKVTFDDQTTGAKHIFQHEDGLADFLKKILAERAQQARARRAVRARQGERRCGSKLVLQWTESTDEHLRSYVNGIPTGSGGTHENGLRAGLGKAVRNFIETHDLTPKGVTLTAEDIREGLTGVLSVFVAEPQFQGQTKDRLNNPEVPVAVDGLVRPALEHWLNTNSSSPRRSSRGSSWRRGRARPAAPRRPEVVRKGPTAGRLNLPGKLADCTHPGADHQRAVHRRGRLGRRLGQAGPRPRAPGDPAAARQGAQHRRHGHRQGAREQGAGRPRHRARLRRRQGLRPRRACATARSSS